MSSRKTLFTLPITTYEAAFLATIPLPPEPFPRYSNSGSSSGGRKSRKCRRSRWHKEEEVVVEEKYSYMYSTQYYQQEQVTNGHHDGIYPAGLMEGEYLDIFRPPTPLKIEDDEAGAAKLHVPEVIVTAGDRKGSFDNMEFNMYYEIHPESIKINCKNLSVPNALVNHNHYSQISIASSAVAGETNSYYPCSRLAEQADVLEKWLDGFYSEKEQSSVNSGGKCCDESAVSDLVNNHSSSSSDPHLSSADRNNVQHYYQNPDSNSCELNESEQVNGAWISNSKVKLGKFKFLRNEHFSDLVATSNRVGASGELVRTSKSAVSDDSDSGGWATETVEESRANEGEGRESEENTETRDETSSNLSKSGKKRGKGATSGSTKNEPAGERRRSSRIRSMEEKREKEREEKLKETKDDGATNSTSETSSPAQASPTPPPISSSADSREETTASSLDAKASNESDSRTSGEFAVPPSPWNGVYAKSNHQHRESESGSSPSANTLGAPVKVKSRWRRCSELESVVRDNGNGLSNSKMYNSAPCSPTSLGTARMVSELFHLARPPPPPPSMNSVGFFGPGEITEDWSEQEVSTSLTKNPLPLKLRPVPAPALIEVKGPLPPPPPPPKEKPPYLNYDEITENVHLSTRLRSKARKEVRRMVCDCTLTKEEIVRGYQGCGDDCLNRLLMMECGSRCPTGERCGNRKFQKKEYANIEPFKTDMKGYGLKCKEDLDEGEFVIEYVGEVLDQREFKKRVKEYAADKQRHHYFMALKADQIIDATQRGNFSRFINHSCDPNCETQKWTVSGELRIGFFTRRAIKSGEEITFDYQFQRYGKEAQRCYCEASNCRGLIGGDKQTPLKKEKEKDKKDKKRRTYEERRREFGEDVDLQEEIEKFSQLKGLANRNQTLNLCRLMVRAEDVESRTILLCCLQRTNEAACLRLFLDYHGLSLIWSWMMDTGNNETSIPFKAEVLKTLSKLPVASRSMVMENKLMPAIQKWAAQIVDAENARKQEKAEENKDEKIETDENKENDVCIDSVNLSINQICPVEKSNRSVDDEISCQELLDQSETTNSPRKTEDVSDTKICGKKDETAINEIMTNGDIKMECEPENSNSDLPSDLANESENILVDVKSEPGNECEKKNISDQLEESLEMGKVNSNENEPSSINIEKVENIIEQPSNASEPISVSIDDGEKIKLEVLQSSVANLAASLLDSWSELKQLYRIPKREQAQNRKDHEREADGDSDEEDDYDDEDDKEYNDRDRYYRDRDRDEDDRHRRDRGRRDHREDRDKWRYNSKKRRLNCRPRISKEERRQQFEQKVQQEEQEALRWQQAEYFRQQQEAQMEAQAQMEMYYSAGYASLPGQAIAYYDPNSGYTIPAIATAPPMTTDALLVATTGVIDTTPSTATPDITMAGIPTITTIVPTVIPQVAPLDASITSPITGVPAIVSGPEAIVAVPTTSVYDTSVTPGPVPAPVVYPIYSTATNPASTGFIANSSAAPFITSQGQPIYYPPPQGVVVIPPDQTAWSHIIPAVETPPSAPPEPPKPAKLPPSWKTAKDDEGNTYYYHAVTRQTQWDPPTCDEEEEEASVELLPVENHKQSKKSNSESSSEYSRRIKESFRSKMSQFIVQYLNPYRKPDCKQGRIASTEEFKHLARKLTHFVMAKELKYCRNVEDLECNENVKHKAKDFVKKYMGKFGANYKKTASPKDDDEI